MLARRGHRLLRLGVALLLLTSFWGFQFPYLASPRLGLSAHTLSALVAVLMLVMGLVWARLNLGPVAAGVAFWLLIYSSLAIIAAYVLGAVWAAGNDTMRLAAESAHGSSFQERIIKIVAYSSAPTGVISFALILYGLRWWRCYPDLALPVTSRGGSGHFTVAQDWLARNEQDLALRLFRRQLVDQLGPLAFDHGSHFIRGMADTFYFEHVFMQPSQVGRRRRCLTQHSLPGGPLRPYLGRTYTD